MAKQGQVQCFFMGLKNIKKDENLSPNITALEISEHRTLIYIFYSESLCERNTKVPESLNSRLRGAESSRHFACILLY